MFMFAISTIRIGIVFRDPKQSYYFKRIEHFFSFLFFPVLYTLEENVFDAIHSLKRFTAQSEMIKNEWKTRNQNKDE